MAGFLHWLFRDCPGRVCVGTIDPSQWWDEPIDQLTLPTGLLKPRRDGQYRGVYYRCTTLAHELPEQFVRGKRDNFAAMPGLWADIDVAGTNHKTEQALPPTFKDAVAVYRNAGYPQPSAVIVSGGGLHVWWRLTECVTDREVATELSRRWGDGLVCSGARLGWHVDYVGNTDRVLRLPGTINQKNGVECRVAAIKEDRSYTADELTEYANQWYEPRVAVEPRREGNPEGVFAKFSATWAEILTPHGWEVHHTEGERTFWTRPGKRVEDGHSAVTDTCMYVFSSAVEELPVNEEMTKSHVWGLLNNYGGATRECARAIERRNGQAESHGDG